MKMYEIKISGSGTKNQIEIALMQIVQNLQFSDEKENFVLDTLYSNGMKGLKN